MACPSQSATPPWRTPESNARPTLRAVTKHKASSSPWQKSGVAPRAPMVRAARASRGRALLCQARTPGKTRGARISGIFERRAEPSARGARGGTPRTKTQSGGMQRRSNAGGLLPRAARTPGRLSTPPCIHISGANRHGRATANGENRTRCRKFMFPVSPCLSISNMTWGRLFGEIPALSTTLSTGWQYLRTTRVPSYPPPLANLSLGKAIPAC